MLMMTWLDVGFEWCRVYMYLDEKKMQEYMKIEEHTLTLGIGNKESK